MDVARANAQRGAAAGLAVARAQSLDISRGRVKALVTARAGTLAEVRSRVAALGGEVQETADSVLQVLLPPAGLAALAGDASVRWVRRPPVRTASAVVDEGVAATHADALHAEGLDGRGVKVAVIDGGFQNLAAVFGDPLPAWVVKTQSFHCANGIEGDTDHGTAVAEIVHQMAPGAQLELMCMDTVLNLQAAEQQAVSDGVKIINHSIGWFGTSRGDGTGGPGTPDAIVADARANGILWVNAAGNSAPIHWTGTFRPMPSDPNLNDFGGGNASAAVQIDSGATACPTLTWDDWPVTSEDFDWGLFDTSTSPATLVASSTDDQATAPAPPVEQACYTNETTSAKTYALVIARYSAVGTPRLDLQVPGALSLSPATAGGSVVEPATSPDAVAVGAACWQSGAEESFSSRGPTIDGRTKPELLAPDSTSSSVYGAFSSCGSSGFAGTSAAAPHVAGAAAVLAQKFPLAGADQLEELLLAQVPSSAARIPNTASDLWLHPPFSGSPIVYSDGQIGFANADGTNGTRLTTDANVASEPALSPDGTKIAFASAQDGDYEVYALNLADGTRTALTSNSARDEGPAWSPDGTTVAFASNRDGNWELYRTDAGGGTLIRLTNNATDDFEPAWSSTGKIAFTAVTTLPGGYIRYDIYTMNIDGTGRTNLTNGTLGPSNQDPAWSPDGTTIAFTSGTAGAGIYVMNADGSNETLVTRDALGATPSRPSWTADGQRLLFGEGGDLYSVARDGSGLVKLTDTPAPNDENWPAGQTMTSVAPYVAAPVGLRGGAQVGEPLAADPVPWVGTLPMTFAYQWQRCEDGIGCSPIPGATHRSFVPAAADRGFRLRLRMEATNSVGTRIGDSVETAPVTPAAPVVETLPGEAGAAQVGSTLSSTGDGTWSNAPTSFAHRWRRCDADGGDCADIAGATAPTYTLQAADQGSTIRFAVLATNAGGSTPASSQQSAVVTATGNGGGSTSGGSSNGGGSIGGGGGGNATNADLTVALTANQSTATPVGTEILYFATVKLATPANFSDTRLDVTLPDVLTYERSSTDRGSCSRTSTGLSCNTAWVSPGVETHVTIWVLVAKEGELDVTATVRSLLEQDFNPANDSVTLKLLPPTSTVGVGAGGGGAETPPSVGRPPAIGGKPVVGQTLRAAPPRWTTAPTSVLYRWLLCTKGRCTPIPGATKASLKLRRSYAGHAVRIVVTGVFPTTSIRASSKLVLVRRP